MITWTEKKLKEMEDMFLKGGRTYKYISEKFGVKVGVIAGILHRRGIKRGKKLQPTGVVRLPRAKRPGPARVLVQRKRVVKSDIIEIKAFGECRGIVGNAEGLALKLCREEIPIHKNYCEHHQKLYYR